MRESLAAYCARLHRRDLLDQWDGSRNGTLTPDTVSYGSRQKLWWRCEQGHVWQAAVYTRAGGESGCPYCAGKRPWPGFNDLASQYPDLAAQWHPTKNGDLRPQDVVAGSRRKVWWQCPKGHVWQAAIASRAGGGAGCPVCAGKQVVPGENDLATLFPQLAQQWDREKNGALTPQQVSSYSNRAAWWRCPLGHSWRAAISARAWGSDCPYCAGRKVLPGFNDLATRDPAVAAEWDPDLNGALTPQMVTAGSHKKAWWRCPENHVWKAVVYSRTGPKHCGCPVCAGKAKQTRGRDYATLPSPGHTMNAGRESKT